MSTLPLKCQQLFISGYVLGNLSPAEAALFEEILRENPKLNDQVSRMRDSLNVDYTPSKREQLLISGYVLDNLSPEEALLFEQMLSENYQLHEHINAIQQTLDIDVPLDRSEPSLISGYVLGNLSPEEAVLFEQMLNENPNLNEEVITTQKALDLAYAPTEVAPPPALRNRILTTANAQKAKSLAPETVTNSSKSLSSASKILGAIALALITTLAVTNYLWWHKTIQSVKITELQNKQGDQLTYSLDSEDTANKSTAKLIVDRGRLNATLNVNNLPLLPPEKVYALWTLVGKNVPYTTDNKGAILTAVFQVNESGNFTQKIAIPQPHLKPKNIKKIAITVEDISSPQAHQGSIFISTGN